MVNPGQYVALGNARLIGELLATTARRAVDEQVQDRINADATQLLTVGRADALDVLDFPTEFRRRWA